MGWVCLITAVTAGQLSARAKRRAEEAEVGKREIERLYAELRDAFQRASHAEALRQSEKLKSALLDAVTHDLRTPLTSIKASITTLLDEVRGGKPPVALDPDSSLLARDRFLPRQLAKRGARLVFSNGIVILAVFSGLLVMAFGGDTSRLIPLYAIGVFLSFTLSQSGMVIHWLRERVTSHANWKKSLVINAIGALATFIVLCVFVATKFIHGAWIVVVVIPLLVLLFRAIRKHYVMVAKQLSMEGLEPLRPIKHTVIVPISGIHRGVVSALQYARSNSDDIITVVLPEFSPARWWQHLLHNQSSLLLKGSLLFKKGVIVTSVPYHLEH